jgi:hypothetical protein
MPLRDQPKPPQQDDREGFLESALLAAWRLRAHDRAGWTATIVSALALD